MSIRPSRSGLGPRLTPCWPWADLPVAVVERAGADRAVIIGSGLAGLTAALALGDCTVVTKTALGDGASRHAQGGIAAAFGDDDSPAAHAEDTVAVGGGLTDPRIAQLVANAAGERVTWLQELGAAFDLTVSDTSQTRRGHEATLDRRHRSTFTLGHEEALRRGSTFALGREAGHSRRRIVHANGDATGAEIMRALITAVRQRADIEVLEYTHAIDLVRVGGRIGGVLVSDDAEDRRILLADAIVLGTGGIGRLYAHTTNPAEATGDGLAMAIRAGAAIRDPEFVQFHPTALASHLDPLPLLTEALRGDGAHLIDAAGRRYLLDVHPAAELAPRDVVARANWREQQRGPIYLDARSLGASLPERFPTVFALAGQAGLDPRTEPLPVSPAQHYHMGGVVTDEDGRTSLAGLFACGEVASTGLHGANRLASNSLVEGLVLGTRVARAIGRAAANNDRGFAIGAIGAIGAIDVGRSGPAVGVEDGSLDLVGLKEDWEAIAQVRQLMWERGGLVRDGAGLRKGLTELSMLAPRLSAGLVGRNLATVARVILEAGLARQESRGSHFRADHPREAFGAGRHTVLAPAAMPTVRRSQARTGVGSR